MKREDEKQNGGAPHDRSRSHNKSCLRLVLLFCALVLVECGGKPALRRCSVRTPFLYVLPVLFLFAGATICLGCIALFVCSLPPQVVYPVFVVGMMCRVIFFRVRPNAGGIIFTYTKKDPFYATSGRRCWNFFSRVLKGMGWRETHHDGNLWQIRA